MFFYKILYIVLVLFYISCNSKQKEKIEFQDIKAKDIVENKESQEFAIKTQLPKNLSVSRVYNIDLDGDDFEEQVVLYKPKDKLDGNINFYILSVGNNKKDYNIVYSSMLLSSNINMSNFYTDDFTGDKNAELVFLGLSNLGEETIDIISQNNKLFTPILSIKTTGYLTIQKNELDGKTTVSSFEESDKVNIFNIKEYSYIEKLKKYDVVSQGRIIEESPSNENNVTFKTKDEMLNFVSTSLWGSKDKNYTIDIKDELFHVLKVHPDGEKTIEYYKIKTSIKSRNNNIMSLYLENQIISEENERITIRVIDFQTIEIIFTLNFSQNGIYSILKDNNTNNVNNNYNILGSYIDDYGIKYIFSDNSLILRSNNKDIKGSYIVYKLKDNLVMQIEYFSDENHLIRKDYFIDFENSNNTIKLTPIKIMVSKIIKTQDEFITLNKEIKIP